jgi:hypothetical protein
LLRLRSWPTGDLGVVGPTNPSGGTTTMQPGLAGLALVPQAPAPACRADLTGDGTVDGTDFIAFINSFGIGDPADVAGAGASSNSPGGAIDRSELPVHQSVCDWMLNRSQVAGEHQGGTSHGVLFCFTRVARHFYHPSACLASGLSRLCNQRVKVARCTPLATGSQRAVSAILLLRILKTITARALLYG